MTDNKAIEIVTNDSLVTEGNQNIEDFITEKGALQVLQKLKKHERGLCYVYGAVLSVIFNEYSKNLVFAKEKYGYNSFKEFIEQHECFSGPYTVQTWYNYKTAYETAKKHNLSLDDLIKNDIKYSKLLNLKEVEFNSKEEVINELKKKPSDKVAHSISLPLNPDLDVSDHNQVNVTRDDNTRYGNDGYNYPVDEAPAMEFSEQKGNLEVIPKAWDAIPPQNDQVRSFKVTMALGDYEEFIADLETLEEMLPIELPSLFSSEENRTTLRNKVLCFIAQFARQNYSTLLDQYKNFNGVL